MTTPNITPSPNGRDAFKRKLRALIAILGGRDVLDELLAEITEEDRPPYHCPENDPNCPENGNDFMCRSEEEREQEREDHDCIHGVSFTEDCDECEEIPNE